MIDHRRDTLCLSKEGADSIVMTHNGSPVWTLVLFGLCTVPLGLFLWHKQGTHFGFSSAKGVVDGKATAVSACLLVALVLIESIFNGQ